MYLKAIVTLSLVFSDIVTRREVNLPIQIRGLRTNRNILQKLNIRL